MTKDEIAELLKNVLLFITDINIKRKKTIYENSLKLILKNFQILLKLIIKLKNITNREAEVFHSFKFYFNGKTTR